MSLDPETTGAWSNLELDPRGVDHSVFEEDSGEYEALSPRRRRRIARSALRAVSSLIKTDLAAALQAYDQLREMGIEFADKAAVPFAQAAALCAAQPDRRQDALRWLAAIPTDFSFTLLHQTLVADLLRQTASALVSLEGAAEDTQQANELAMALHIVVARGLHVVRTGTGNALRRTIQRCFMSIVRYSSMAQVIGTTDQSSTTSVPPSWLEWKRLEDAMFEREEDASLGADEHPALFRNDSELSPALVSARLRSSIFRNSIRVLASSMRQRDALFWALRSSSIEEGASADTDLDAFTVKVVVEEALKRPRDDLVTRRLLDTLLSRLEAAKRDAVEDIDKRHFGGLLDAAMLAHSSTGDHLARQRSSKQLVSKAIVANVNAGELQAAFTKASDALKTGHTSDQPSTSSLSTLLRALEASGMSESVSQLDQRMKSSNSTFRPSVIDTVAELVQEKRYAEAIAAWRAHFSDDGGICDDVCRIALGEPAPREEGQPAPPARSQIWPRKGDVVVMLRALVGACLERGASLDDLYHTWLRNAFDVAPDALAGSETRRKAWRRGSVEVGSPCFDVFLVAFARTWRKRGAAARLTRILQDMKDVGVEVPVSSWTKLLETLAKEEILPVEEQEPEELPRRRGKSKAKARSRGRFDGVDVDSEGLPAGAQTTDLSPAWNSNTMKLARSMGIGAPDGSPEPHMPRASLPTYISLIGGLLAGPSMKGWRALSLCLDVREHLEAEAHRGVAFTMDDIKREPRAQQVLKRLAWFERENKDPSLARRSKEELS